VTNSKIKKKADLLAQTLTMLSETVERYDLFADQMEMANNPGATEIFQWLSAKQTERTKIVQELSEGKDLPHIEPWNYNWDDAINVDANGHTSAHYMMTPHHALKFALQVEKSAADFFADVEAHTKSSKVKKLAKSFGADAKDFCKAIEVELEKHPEPDEGWDEDPDPPQFHE